MAETPKPDETLDLLNQLYDKLVRLGHRDDPLVMQVGEHLEELNPKPEENKQEGQSPQ